MKILLIQPPVRQRAVPQDIPYGLGIIASIAESLEHEIAFLDLNANRVPLQIAAEEIASDDFDIIGIGGLSSMYKDIRKLLPICRKIHPDALIVAGGGFVTYMPDKILRLSSEVDIAVIGEGEDSWKEILQNSNRPEGDITGVRLPVGDHKRTEWLYQIAPYIKNVFVPFTPGDKSSKVSRENMQTIAKELGFNIIEKSLEDESQIDQFIKNIPDNIDAIILPRDSIIESKIEKFVNLYEDIKNNG